MTKEHQTRVRRICEAFAGTEEKVSHGEPAFFVRKKMYAMFANNHHNDGRIAVWVAAPVGMQGTMFEQEPHKYFKPPYVGVRGWIGLNLEHVSDDELEWHVLEAWRLIGRKP